MSARIGRRRKGGNRAAGEIPIYIGMVKNDGAADGRELGGGGKAGLETMYGFQMESGVVAEFGGFSPLKSGGGADCPAVNPQNAFQI